MKSIYRSPFLFDAILTVQPVDINTISVLTIRLTVIKTRLSAILENTVIVATMTGTKNKAKCFNKKFEVLSTQSSFTKPVNSEVTNKIRPNTLPGSGRLKMKTKNSPRNKKPIKIVNPSNLKTSKHIMI